MAKVINDLQMDNNVDITSDLQCTVCFSNRGKRKRESDIDDSDTGLPTAVTEHDYQESDEKVTKLLSPQIIACNIQERSLEFDANLSEAQGCLETTRFIPIDNDTVVDSEWDVMRNFIVDDSRSLSSTLVVGGASSVSIASINAPTTSGEGEQVEAPIIRGLVSDYFSLNGPDRSFSGGTRFPGDLLDVHKQWRKKYFYEQTTYYSLNEAYECPYGWMYTRFEITDNWKDNGTNGKGSITFSGDSRKAYLVIDGLPRKGVDWSIKIWKTKG